MYALNQIFAIIFYILFLIWIFFKIRNVVLIKKLNCKEIYKNIRKDFKKEKNVKILFKIMIISIIIFIIYLVIGFITGILALFMMFITLGGAAYVDIGADSSFYENLMSFVSVHFGLLKYIGYYLYFHVYLILIREIYINILSYRKLKKEFFTSLKNYEFKLTEQSAYEIALWIESNEKHLSASQQNNFTKYNLGEILLVDLGWNNYDREFAYRHPAIVIKETSTKIFVVLCSSGNPRKDKKGNIYPEFEVGTIEDGFQRNTVVMLYEAKYIDKNRVISRLGKTSNQFFDKIYNKLFEQIFEPLHYKMQKLENNQ